MSIAVSAVVHPSRLLLSLVSAMSAITLAVALVVGVGFLTDVSLLIRFLTSTSCTFLAVFGFYHGARYRKAIHIDISGTGQVKVTEIDSKRPCTITNWPHVSSNAEQVQLTKHSTIWPHLMLLLLRSESGRGRVLIILPDSVSPESFRKLSVACRWIAAHAF